MDKHKCSGCDGAFPPHMLDTVLLDEQARSTSSEMYCERCFDRNKIVEWDSWSLGDEDKER